MQKLNPIIRFFIFLVINFGALYIGSILQGEGPSSNWYQGLNQAPWVPPGWVFGAAWFSIMLCFTIFLTKVSEIKPFKGFGALFIVQFILNVSWNPIFFNLKLVLPALIVITCLMFLMWLWFFKSKDVKGFRFLLLPYCIWLTIATSLNGYVLLFN